MQMDQLRGKGGVQLGHSAIDQIDTYQLSATPQNYEVWLNYITGWSPDLKKSIDTVLKNGDQLTDARIEEMHERFFSTTQLSSQVMETGNRIAQEIADALEALNQAGATTERYGATLESASKTLNKADLSGDAIQRIVSVLSSATTEMSSQNASLNEKLQQSTSEMEHLRASLQAARAEALTDSLTGIANRKLFDETLRTRKVESEEEDYELCLILCDIDHFKTFNDTWGHQTGDQVIRFVAGSLGAHALPDHLVARYGGEEFAIVMPRTSIEKAEQIAEKIRTAIQAKKLMRRSTNEPLGQVTVSFGISRFRSGETIQSLIERADANLYHSKETGRNRVTSETDEGEKSAA